MTGSVKEQFDRVAQRYDQQRRQLIPCFDSFYGAAVDWTNSDEKTPNILDLGAGTGLFSALVKEKLPNARFTLIDISGAMLDMARERFANDAAHADMAYIAADYVTYPYTETYDCVISALSIHHLTHEDKQRLFQTIFRLLKPGGTFVNADQVLGETPFFVDRYQQEWEKAIRASGLSQEAIEAAIDRRRLDRNARAHDQLQWLRDAGFPHVDCVYQHHDFAVFVSQKSE